VRIDLDVINTSTDKHENGIPNLLQYCMPFLSCVRPTFNILTLQNFENDMSACERE
jgi:hypothetical protein